MEKILLWMLSILKYPASWFKAFLDFVFDHLESFGWIVIVALIAGFFIGTVEWIRDFFHSFTGRK